MARAPLPAEVVAEEEMPAADMAMADDMAMEGMDEPVVVLTVLRNSDGSYTLEGGAEPEIDPALAAGGPAPVVAGQSFQPDEAGVGELMTAILDLVDPDNAGSPQAAANFAEGFSGPAPKAEAA